MARKRKKHEDDQESSLSAYIDRVEGNLAVIVFNDEENEPINVPIDQLPPEAQAGGWLTIQTDADGNRKYLIDRQGTEKTRQRVTELQTQLLQENDQDQLNIKL